MSNFHSPRLKREASSYTSGVLAVDRNDIGVLLLCQKRISRERRSLMPIETQSVNFLPTPEVSLSTQSAGEIFTLSPRGCLKITAALTLWAIVWNLDSSFSPGTVKPK